MKLNLLKKNHLYLILYIFTLSTAFSFTVSPNHLNYAVIAIAAIGFLLFFLEFNVIYLNKWSVQFYLLFTTLSIVVNIDNARFGTIYYQLALFFSFLYFMQSLRKGRLAINNYAILCKYIIYLYFIVLIGQQFSLQFGIPIPNLISSEIEIGKLNSLATEPSLAGVILTTLLYSIFSTSKLLLEKNADLKTIIKSNYSVVFAYFYCIVSMKSSLAIILVFMYVTSHIDLKNIKSIAFASLVGITIFAAIWIQDHALTRAITFITSLFTMDTELIIEADHSASLRILPAYFYIISMDIFDVQFWIGKGIDSNISVFQPIIPGVEEGNGVGGLFPSHFINYGALSGVFLLITILRFTTIRILSFETIFLGTVFLTSSLNTQTTWITITLFSTTNYFKKMENRTI